MMSHVFLVQMACISEFVSFNLLRYSNISIILKLKSLLKQRLILRILNLLQNLSSSLKIIR